MLALAFGGPSTLRAGFQRDAVRAGCVAYHEDDAAWLGGAFPSLRSADGGAWSDASLRVQLGGGKAILTCAAPTNRSMYVAWSAGTLLASTSLEHLVGVLGSRVSSAGLAACVLALGLPDRVPFHGIERLPGGEAWSFGPGQEREVMRAEHRAGSTAPADVEEATELLRRAVTESVGRASAGAGRIGVLLSGGLDSSAVLAALVEHVPCDRIVAVTWALDERQGDRPFVDAWSRRLGLTVERVTAADCAPLVAQSLVLGAAPVALMTGAFERAAMRRAHSRGADMLLTGVGGDESFAGSLQAAASAHAAGAEPLRRALRAELPWIGTPLGRLSELWLRPRVRPLVPRWVRERAFARRALRELPMRSALLERRLHEAAALHVAVLPRVPQTPAERWSEAVRRPFWLEMGELRAQLEAAEGMPRFDVPLDPELHQILATISPRFLFDEDRFRGLLRRVLQGRAPQIVTARADKADFEPFALAMLRRAGVADHWAELARGEALFRLGVGPRGGIGDTWRDPTESVGALEALLPCWPVLAAEAFARRYA